MKRFFSLFAGLLLSAELFAISYSDISLDGKWEYGLGRRYSGVTMVPGFPLETSEIADEALWYRTRITLPAGDWNRAQLELKGARFRPEVYVDGVLVSRREGGMARTMHPLGDLKPGKKISLEIKLASLKDTPSEDASQIPVVDRWRSNVSSCLWDDVVLHLYKDARADRLLVDYDSESKSASATFRVCGTGAVKSRLSFSKGGEELFHIVSEGTEGEHRVRVDCRDRFGEWSPERPNCYQAKVELFNGEGACVSEYVQTVGFREFRTSGKQLRMNGRPYRVRGGSLVWHRWMRDKDSREIGLSRKWIEDNIGKRVKERGGNYLRFHLGVPPERILDMCDSLGLAVQYEWSFFHGMPASLESLMEQYGAWLDMASRHPSVMFIHPYNETDKEQLARVWKALDSLAVHYPPMVMADRDVYHIHRYWWGMSENLGLYFDSYEQFRKPIVVDELGGVYLDGDGNIGGYIHLPAGILRLLGYDNTAEMRLHHQNLAYGKVGEYWRRIGASGVAAFPIVCSWNDGNHWFSGPIAEGRLKEVWNKMTVVWADRTVSMDVWDRDYVGGQRISFPIHFINDSGEDSVLEAKFELLDSEGKVRSTRYFKENVSAGGRKIVKLKGVSMPREKGDYLFRTTLLNPSEGITEPVVGEWEVRVIKAEVPANLADARIWAPRCEREIRKMARRQHLHLVRKPARADLLVFGRKSWADIDGYTGLLEESIGRGASAVMLEIGNRGRGIAYNDGAQDLGCLSGSPRMPAGARPEKDSTLLFGGLKVRSTKVTEGESHLQQPRGNNELWYGLKREYTYLWNGLRGGLIVPAYTLEAEAASTTTHITPLVVAGKKLARTSVVRVDFGPGEGSVILSQLYTEGRLARRCAEKSKYYPAHYDEAAVQFVLNICSVALKKE